MSLVFRVQGATLKRVSRTLEDFKHQLSEWAALGLGLGRGAYYLSQLRALQLASRVWLEGGFPSRTRDKTIERRLFRELLELVREDARTFGQGALPLGVLSPESPIKHGLRACSIAWDGLRILRQKKKGRTTVFSAEAKERLSEKPRYYQRNFHFQQDGYLSERSADLYEHQVEILFAGMADPMRRMVLKPLLERWGPTRGAGLKILEIGCGTGCTSRFVLEALPQARLTVTDLSEVYLKKARSNLSGYEQVDFVQAPGETLPFQTGTFDAVFSVFLFHELPLEVRRQVLREQARVVQAGGLVIAVDSLQAHDIPEVLPVLEQFPKDFHEPFYSNYIETPLEGLFAEAGIRDLATSTGFVSKRVSGLAFAS
jgi:ubiquinone/menaquinone biosynthesis C-methylase UbiE